MEIVDWGERTAGSESRRARNRRHRSKASTAVTAGTSRPLPAPPPPHEAGYVPRLRPGTGRQPAAARPGSTIPSWGLEGRANIEQGAWDSPRLQGAQEHRTPQRRGVPNHAVLVPCLSRLAHPSAVDRPSSCGAGPYLRLPHRRAARRHDHALWRRPEPLSETRPFVQDAGSQR